MATFLKILFLFPQIDLWQQCADQFTPPATFLQCRKYFEQKRTAFGKIETFEMRSGSAARERTTREQDIMETWSFLKGHIAHIPTVSSQHFSSGQESSSSDTSISGLSAHSIQRRRAKKKRAPPSSPAASTSNAPRDVVDDRDRVIGTLLDTASELRATAAKNPPTMGEMYGNIIGKQLNKIQTDDLLPFVSPMLNYIMQCSALSKQNPTEAPPPSMTSMLVPPMSLGASAAALHQMPPPPASAPGLHQMPPTPASGPALHQMPPPPPASGPSTSRYQMPPPDQGMHYHMPASSGYQPQQPPVIGYQQPASPGPYQAQSSPVSPYPYSSSYQVPTPPMLGRAPQHPSQIVYTPISGVFSGKPAPTQSSPSKMLRSPQMFEGLDSLSPLNVATPSPLTAILNTAVAGTSSSKEINSPASKDEEDDDNGNGNGNEEVDI